MNKRILNKSMDIHSLWNNQTSHASLIPNQQRKCCTPSSRIWGSISDNCVHFQCRTTSHKIRVSCFENTNQIIFRLLCDVRFHSWWTKKKKKRKKNHTKLKVICGFGLIISLRKSTGTQLRGKWHRNKIWRNNLNADISGRIFRAAFQLRGSFQQSRLDFSISCILHTESKHWRTHTHFYTNFLASKKLLRCLICQKPIATRISVWTIDHHRTLWLVLSLVCLKRSSRYWKRRQDTLYCIISCIQDIQTEAYKWYSMLHMCTSGTSVTSRDGLLPLCPPGHKPQQ